SDAGDPPHRPARDRWPAKTFALSRSAGQGRQARDEVRAGVSSMERASAGALAHERDGASQEGAGKRLLTSPRRREVMMKTIRPTTMGLTRRTLMRAGATVLAAPAVLRLIPAHAQSQVIKIGHVSPRTGPLAGFGEADAFILDQVRGILAKGLEIGGKTY